MAWPERVKSYRPGIALCAAALWLTIQVLVAQPGAADPPANPPLTAQQRKQLEERDRLGDEARGLRAAGKLVEAIAAVQRMLAIERNVFGEVHQTVADTLQWLAAMQTEREDFAAARKARQQVLDIKIKLYGEKHWQATDARVELRHTDRLAQLDRRQLKQLNDSDQLLEGARQLIQQNKPGEALPLARKVLEIRRQVLEEEDRFTAWAMADLAWAFTSMGEFAKAESFYRRAAEIDRKVFGDRHPTYAHDLQNLAYTYRSLKEYAKAEPLFRQALEIRGQALGEKHAAYAESRDALLDLLDRLTGEHLQREDFPAARKVRLEVVALRAKQHGEKHWRVTDARLELAHIERLATLTPEQRRQLAEADQLNEKAVGLHGQGRIREAVPLAQRALEIRKQLLGEQHPHCATSLNNLAEMYRSVGEHAQAEPLHEKAAQIRRQALGEQHPDYALSLNNLALLYHATGAYARAESLYQQALEIRRQALGEQHPDYALSLNNLAMLYHATGAYARAEPLHEKAAQIRRQALGEQHPDFAQSLNNLALLYQSMGDYRRAERLYQQALEIHKQALGEQHPQYAASLNNLASLYEGQGGYAKAEPLYRQALAILKDALGEKHPDCATTLNNLALLYQRRGDYAKAEPLYRQALAIRKEVLGEKHSDYAQSLNNLAFLYSSMGDHAKAVPLWQQALEIGKQVLGEKHPTYAGRLNNLALLYQTMGEYTQAEPLYRKSLEIKKQALGEQHPDYALSLNNLAMLYHATGEYVRAEPLHEKAAQISKQALGEQHPDYALSLNNLAVLYYSMGDHAKAVPLLRQALEIRKQALGEQHPDYASTLSDLAVLYASMQEPGRGEPLARQALRATRRHLDLTAVVQSERQQRLMTQALRSQLDNYLSVATGAKASADQIYPEVLAWKGAVLARQQAIRRLQRALQGGEEPEVAKLYAELEQATRALATLSQATPDPKQPDERRQALEKLSEEIERLERDLAAASEAFRKQSEQRRRTAEDIRKVLPADAVLVDLLEYDHFSPPKDGKGKGSWQRRLAAFVVRPEKPVERLDLGPVGPITAAIDEWRKHFGLGGPAKDRDPAAELRRLVWQPLERHLQGAKIVVLSPDGTLACFPWAALPGKEPATYLLEELAVAVVPVPQLLPELLAKSDGAGGEPSLLLVGEVDYQGIPGAGEVVASAWSAPRGDRNGAPQKWQPLAGTRSEVVAIKDSFQRRYRQAPVTELREGEPTENAFRVQAGKHQYLHIATHGFFAPPRLRSALAAASRADNPRAGYLFTQQDVAGFHPGLLSGLVLAGANQPVQPGRDDGILTALEVAALDLGRVELAVLSACETGLGESAGGEGLLGLQRAFQTAGGRSVVASLWQVRDDATRSLMVDFYDNLWRKKLPKAEALRQAQLAMLRDGINRGLKVVEEQPPDKEKRRLPPYYWAAFVLSGDWR